MAQNDVQIKIGANVAAAKQSIAALKQDVQRLGGAVDGAGKTDGIQRLGASFRDAGQAVRGFVVGVAGALASVQAIRTFIRVADDVATLEARLRLATSSAEEFNRSQVALFDLAQRSRTSLAETVRLYAQIATATKDAGVGQETLLQVVETINQAVQLSGASGAAAQAALVQLGQGLSSGTLRGEELNSVLEQTPALAAAIARGMGITTGELRKYGEQGKITGQQVIVALQNQREQVAAQFAQLPLTVGQAITLVGNSLTKLVGLFNESTGATAGLADTLRDISAFLSSDGFISSLTQWASILSQSVAALASDMKRAVQIVSDATQDIAGQGENMNEVLRRAFQELPVNLRTSVQIVSNQIFGLFDRVISYSQLVRDNFKNFLDNEGRDAGFARFQARNRAISENVQVGVDNALAERTAALEEARRVRDGAAAARAKGRIDTGSVGVGKPRAGDTFTGPVVDAFALARDASQRGIKEIEALYRAAEVSLRDYLDRRNALQLAAIDAEIGQERRKLAEAVKARKQDAASSAATAVARLQAERSALGGSQGREEAALFRAQADARLQLEAQRLEQQGQLEAAAQIRLQAQFRDTLDRLRVEGDQAGIDLVNGIINTEASRARFAELRAQFERVQQELATRTQAIADQRTSGTVGFGQADAAQAEARTAATVQLQALNAQFQELATRTNDPAIVAGAQAVTNALRQIEQEGLTGLPRALAELRGQLVALEKNLFTDISRAGTNSVTQFFTDISSGTVSAAEAIRNFARNFIQQLAAIAAQALATRAILALLGVPAGGGLGSISPFVNHSGGMAGTGPKRSVPAWTFAGAPRLHSGLKADEFPAILQSGEEVLSRSDPKNSANGSGGGGVRIVNVIDPNLVNDYMQSASGERTIVNTIQRNRGQIKQALG